MVSVRELFARAKGRLTAPQLSRAVGLVTDLRQRAIDAGALRTPMTGAAIPTLTTPADEVVSNVPVGAIAGTVATSAVAGGGVGFFAGRRRRRAKAKKAKKGKRRTGRKLKFGSPAWRKKYAKKARRSKAKGGKRRSADDGRYDGKKVRYTKNGQPYVLLANGKAKFVKGRRKKR